MKLIMNALLICTLCIFGSKLKIENSNFKEIEPGVATGNIVTMFEVQLRSSGGKKITIDEVWLKNHKAKWELTDQNENAVDSIKGKEVFNLKGQISTKPEGVPAKSKTVESLGSYEEEFVVTYKVEGSDELKLLVIEKIENIERVKMQ